jgi:Ca2+-transporting ATPase
VVREDSGVLEVVGDPMEAALVIAAEKAGLRRRDLLRQAPELREVAFDPDFKLMATYHQDGDEVLVAAKGAPEALLEASSMTATATGPQSLTTAAREHWLAINETMAPSRTRGSCSSA